MTKRTGERIVRPVVAGLVGAGVAVAVAFAEGTAITAKSREYDMGGIPILFAALGFVPFVAGIVAGLVAPRRVYLAGIIAWIGMAVARAILDAMPGPDNPAKSYLVPIPVTIPFALWGALIVDLHPPRFRGFRESSMVFAFLMSLLAIIPIADYWLPGKTAWLAVGILAMFFLWIARRNRRTLGRSRIEEADTTDLAGRDTAGPPGRRPQRAAHGCRGSEPRGSSAA